MKFTPPFKKIIFLSILIIISFHNLFSQNPIRWNVNGNTAVNGDFLGTTNNEPLVFKTNNTEVMRLKANGELRVNNLGGFGNGIVTTNNNGVLSTTAFPNDPTKVLTGNGTFASFSSVGGWAFNGTKIYNANPGFVGIGTVNPQYLFDVNGDARVNGTLYAMGLVLATKMEADTVKGSSMISVNNNLNLSAGILNEMYTQTGDLRIQSRIGNNGNTIISAGTNGKLGIGNFNPQYKLDVNGDVRVSGKMYTNRIVGLPGRATA